MLFIQIIIIIFLLSVLAIIYYDEYRKIALSRKIARLKELWNGHQERRKSVRINTEFDVLYEVEAQKKSPKRSSTTKNISAGGLKLILNEKLLPGAALKLDFNVPQHKEPIHTLGKIAWVKEVADGLNAQNDQRLFATGIQFLQIKPKDEAALRNFINERIKECQEGIITPYEEH